MLCSHATYVFLSDRKVTDSTICVLRTSLCFLSQVPVQKLEGHLCILHLCNGIHELLEISA